MASILELPMENRVMRKVAWRLVPLVSLAYLINVLDRFNISFAALTMNKALGLSATAYGLGAGAFFWSYVLFQVPANMILAKVGARRWFARIMVTWGLATIAVALAWGPASMIVLRTIVGIAEAGFAPGLVLFVTLWYPQFYRASAQSGFMISQPIAGVLGATVGGLILGMTGVLGLAGWRWLFIIEGIPAVILGIVCWFYLTSRPSEAKWLSPDERATLEAALKRDAEERETMVAAGERPSLLSLVLSKDMLILSFCFGCMVANFSALGGWMPQIVRDIVAPGTPYWVIGFISAIPSLCTIAAIPLWSRHSDRRREKFWHSVGAVFVGAVAWEVAAISHMPVIRMAALVVASVTTIAAWPIVFTMPAAVLPRSAHAVGIAFLNTVGIGGAAISPLIMGIIRDRTGSFSMAMAAMGVILAVGAGLVFLVPRRLLNAGAPASARS
jgi:MFS transporter, ACS family, 4-hydroxyphenylacetate permease